MEKDRYCCQGITGMARALLREKAGALYSRRNML